MKNNKKIIAALTAIVMMSAAFGCSANNSYIDYPVGAKMSFWNDPGAMDYDANLFYKNEMRLYGADPHSVYLSAADITDSYEKLKLKYLYREQDNESWINGYDENKFVSQYGSLDDWINNYAESYYMTNTDGSGGLTASDAEKYNCNEAMFPLYRSEDLNNWHIVGKVSGCALAVNTVSDWNRNSHFWAPEIFRDPATGLFFIYYSSGSRYGDGTVLPPKIEKEDNLKISCSVSVTPDGPYYPASSAFYYSYLTKKDENGKDVIGDTELNGPDLNRDGKADYTYFEIYGHDDNVIGYKNGDNYYNKNGCLIDNMTPVLDSMYYFPRLCENREKVNEFETAFHIRNRKGFSDTELDICVSSSIDINPFIDPVSGKMYAYFNINAPVGENLNGSTAGTVWGVEMKDPISPDWNTLRCLLQPKAVKVADKDNSVFGNCIGEHFDEGLNEGPEMIYHNKKYYLSYAPFGYLDRRYAIMFAVGDSPLGDFTKYPDYNPLIGIGTEYNDYMSGTGHHCFIDMGNELFAFYHCFYNAVDNSENGHFMGRVLGFDRVAFRYNEQLGFDIPYGNGPSVGLKPKPENFTGLTNVGKYAQVSGNGDFGSAEFLNDGILTAHSYARKYEYGKTGEKLIIKYDWEKPVTVSALQIFNSGSFYSAFKNVDYVCFKLHEKPEWYSLAEYNGYVYMEDIKTDINDYISEERVVRKGSSATCSFAPVTVTQMVVVISADANNKYTAEHEDFSDLSVNNQIRVSEIYVYGKET